jgi:DNA polymerase III epsilon subunit-like protein
MIAESEASLLGTPKQVRWARRIQADLRDRYPGRALPTVPFASFWIDYRAVSYAELVAAAHDNTLRFSPFSARFPRYAQDEALATLALLASGNYLVLDTETTGLGKGHELTEIAVIDRRETVLLHTRIQPITLARYAGSAAEKTTGLSAERLSCAPTFADVWPVLSPLIASGLPLLAYNAAFDAPMIRRSARASDIAAPPLRMLCAMKLFSAIVENDDSYKLREACAVAGIVLASDVAANEGDLIAHTALGDALATARLVEWMIAQT